MAGQFELGSKHLEYKKQAQAAITEAKADNAKETVKALYSKSYGLLPSENTAYDDYLGLAVSVEEIAKSAPEAAALMVDQVIAQELIQKYATDKTIFSTSEIYAVLCSEPGMSNLNALSTKSVKSANGWNIQGKKSIMKEQLNADKYLIFTNDEEGKVRVFLTGKENVNADQVIKTMAGSNIALNQVQLNIELPESAGIAVINDDYERVLSIARTLISSVALGIAQSSIVTSVNATKETKNTDNMAISNTQSMQFTLADMFADLEQGRMLTYLSANLIDSNKPSIKYATMAKVKTTDTAAQNSVKALQILGNLGFLANNDFADVIQAAVSGQVKGGTNRVQQNQIYQYMLAKK